jgi:hypothetical protein
MSGRSSSVIDEIKRKGSAAQGEEEVRDAIEHERQARARPVMLVVVLKNGDELLLSYALFRRAFKREGGRTWELVFDDCSVVITGRNLSDKLRDLLRMQKLSLLREGNLVEDDLTPDDKAFIESIAIREKDQDEEEEQ